MVTVPAFESENLCYSSGIKRVGAEAVKRLGGKYNDVAPVERCYGGR